MPSRQHPHDEEGGEGPIPWTLREFLSGAYYAMSIGAIMVGLVTWSVVQQSRISYLEAREKEHPTKQELAESAIRIDNRIVGLERNQENAANKAELTAAVNKVNNLSQHVEDLDTHGTVALRERVANIEQINRAQDERMSDFIKRMNEMQASLNKTNEQVILLTERQANVIDTLRRITTGPIGQTGPGAHSPN